MIDYDIDLGRAFLFKFPFWHYFINTKTQAVPGFSFRNYDMKIFTDKNLLDNNNNNNDYNDNDNINNND